MTDPTCPHCLGDHGEDPPGVWVRFVDRQFTAPFRCLCCGTETCALQFAYGRLCARCDTGACQSGNRAYRPEYAHAPWAGRDAYIASMPNAPREVQP